MARLNNRTRSSVCDPEEINEILDKEFNPVKSENPPLYFVPTAILCSCGQKAMLDDSHGYKTDLPNLKVMCTNPVCSESLKTKIIDLSKFAFTEYEILDF